MPSVKNRLTGAALEKALQGKWIIISRYFCYGREDYPDEDFYLSYDEPTWLFHDGTAVFSDLDNCPHTVYFYRIEDDRLILSLLFDDTILPDVEQYRVVLKGEYATFYKLEAVCAPDPSALPHWAETMRIKLYKKRK